jgi:hypothetical protein
MTTDDLTAAHHELTTSLADLRSAHRAAAAAALRLTGSRHSRAAELAEDLADAIAFCDRLCVVVEGDLRSEAAERLFTGGR